MPLHAFSCNRFTAFLLCFILGGIRTLASAGRMVRVKACLRALSRLSSAWKRLFNQYQAHTGRFLSIPSRPARDTAVDGPYNLLCSSLPLESPVPIHVVAPGSLCQEGPVTPFIQDAPPEVNVNQPTTNTAPSSQLHIASELTFGEPHPITTFQLVPPRRTIPRDDPSDIDKTYTHPQMIPENAVQGYIPSYTTDYIPKVNIPGWKMFFRPQGTMYFHREEKNVVTNVNLFNNENLRVVEETIEQLFLKIENDGVDVPLDTQLVIDIFWKKLKVGYYFASLQRRCLFWTHDKYVERLFKRVPNVRSYMHIGHVIEAEFWYLLLKRSCSRHHYQLFPHVQALSPQLIREVKGLLSFMASERVFNAKTTLECSAEEIDTTSSIINSIPVEVIENQGDARPEAAYYHFVVGYIMAFHALHKFDNRHGQPNARCLRGDFLFDDTSLRSRTTIIALFSPILFYTPGTYLHSLESIISDGDVFLEAWHSFVLELHQEWNGLAIFATVLLATNVAFLAIPSLDNGDNPGKRSAAQICSYLSIVLSIGSIALGQLFSRYHRIKGLENLDERIMDNFNLLLDIGCSRLAIMYSLPYAMLSWSVIAFLVAFLIMCFDGTTRLVRCLLGIASAILVLIVVYCVYTMRSNDEERSAGSFVVRCNQKLRELCRRFSPRAWIMRSDSDSVELQSHPLSRSSSIAQIPNV